jgi:hypothetical protein
VPASVLRQADGGRYISLEEAVRRCGFMGRSGGPTKLPSVLGESRVSQPPQSKDGWPRKRSDKWSESVRLGPNFFEAGEGFGGGGELIGEGRGFRAGFFLELEG